MTVKIDRQFMFLHQQNLVVFAERVLRNVQNNPYIPNPSHIWTTLHESNEGLRKALLDNSLKRKERTEALRERESHVLIALSNMADHIEGNAPCKSDVYTTGFRPHTEHRRSIEDGQETRRHQRMSARMAKLEVLHSV
ncbi:MAG: hypothetical protein ACOYNO_03065 [Saprospiraceae bacterium]